MLEGDSILPKGAAREGLHGADLDERELDLIPLGEGFDKRNRSSIPTPESGKAQG